MTISGLCKVLVELRVLGCYRDIDIPAAGVH